MPEPDTPSVAELLAQSRAHHLTKTRLANRRIAGKHAPDYGAAEQAAAQALTLRLQAHQLDPDHIDPAWAADVVPHEQIVAFLTAYPSIP
ncbi:MAG: hypothetical protein RLY20_882 [Verrucomicrobiota bacterium]|jgi:hypothetical protein